MEFIYIFWIIFVLCILGSLAFLIYYLNEPSKPIQTGQSLNGECEKDADCNSGLYCYNTGDAGKSVCKKAQGKSCENSSECGGLVCNGTCGGVSCTPGQLNCSPISGGVGCVQGLIHVPGPTGDICLFDYNQSCQSSSECASNSCNSRACEAFSKPLEVCYSGTGDIKRCYDGDSYGVCLTTSYRSPSLKDTGYCIYNTSGPQKQGDYCDPILFPCDKGLVCSSFGSSGAFTCKTSTSTGIFGDVFGDADPTGKIITGCLPGLKPKIINGKTACIATSGFITDLALAVEDLQVGYTSGYMPSNIYNDNPKISSYFSPCTKSDDCSSGYTCAIVNEGPTGYCVGYFSSSINLPYSAFDYYITQTSSIYPGTISSNYNDPDSSGWYTNNNPNVFINLGQDYATVIQESSSDILGSDNTKVLFSLDSISKSLSLSNGNNLILKISFSNVIINKNYNLTFDSVGENLISYIKEAKFNGNNVSNVSDLINGFSLNSNITSGNTNILEIFFNPSVSGNMIIYNVNLIYIF